MQKIPHISLILFLFYGLFVPLIVIFQDAQVEALRLMKCNDLTFGDLT